VKGERLGTAIRYNYFHRTLLRRYRYGFQKSNHNISRSFSHFRSKRLTLEVVYIYHNYVIYGNYRTSNIMKKFVCYFRVSTKKQGISGLGLEAQKATAQKYIADNAGEEIASFKEVESGKKSDRVQLKEAIQTCKKHDATLLVAKLDRLSRDPSFLFTLQDSGLKFICCDMPEADKFTIGIMIVMAQKERDDISRRTKAAFAAKRARGEKLGNPEFDKVLKLGLKARKQQAKEFADEMAPVIKDIRAKALVFSLNGIAQVLNRRGYKTTRGKEFKAQQVKRLIELMEAA
jgi:DNA invertase Pin-like site-specific DNA recombinase